MTDLVFGQDEDPIEPSYAQPGSVRSREIEHQEAQQGFVDDFKDGFQSTALAGAARVIGDEAGSIMEESEYANPVSSAVLSLFGYRAGEADYDKQDKYEELTADIPFEFHDDIMENDNISAAYRARARVLEDLSRGRRMMQQDSGALVSMAGGLFDVDAPLMLFSGGTFGAAKVAGAALKTSRALRLSPTAALRVSGSAQGLNAGLQVGAIVGSADAHLRETTGWQDVANMALQSMLLGGGIGTAVKGDVRVSVRAAQEEFLGRVSRDDIAFQEQPNLNEMSGDNIIDFMEVQRVDDGSIGAAQVTPDIGLKTPELDSPTGVSPTNQQWIDAAEQWRHDSDWGDRKTAMDDEWWAKVAMHPVANMTTNNFTRLYKSQSSVANYIAGNIFESPGGLGRGRATAATRMENYHRRIQQHLDEDLRSAQAEWAKEQGMTWQGSGYHISQEGLGVFNREVMLELNDRRLGRTSTRNPSIKRAADQYELAGTEALGIGKGREGETAVDGFDGLPDSRGYTPYKWNGAKITQLENAGVMSRADLEKALAEGYRKAGMAVGKDAMAVAKAVIHRSLTKDAELDQSVLSMLTGDGKDFMRESMLLTGMKDAEVDALMDRLIGAQHNRSKESFAKSRNDIDMDQRIPTKDGSDLRVVDLFDQDLHGIWQRYARQMSGSAALARHGITNRAKRKEIIDAMRVEQRALGEEPMDAGLAEAMFSHFNAGPVHGFGWTGTANEGIGHAALAKRIANLSLLEKLGVTQVAETGVIIAQNGLQNWMTRGPMAVLDKELKAGNKELLKELAFFTGDIGRDHWHFAPWLDLDDVTRSEKGDWLHSVNRMTSMGSFVQGYTSAFNQVRAFQQKTAALGVADKVFREIKTAVDTGTDLDPKVRQRFEHDLGLMPEDIQSLEQLVSNGVIEFKTQNGNTFVNRLNTDQWDGEIGEVFASAVTRNINQLVQKSMAGEQDAWMHTHVGSLLMHLKTFPMQAIQKQVLRNARFMDKQALATVLYGMATAAVAVKIRDTLDGRDRDLKDTAVAAFNYSNMTGFIPTLYDPMMTLIGMDGARINQYGPNYDLTPPTLRVANEMMRIPGAIGNTVAGDADWYDKQALKAIPFAGTYVLSRLFD